MFPGYLRQCFCSSISTRHSCWFAIGRHVVADGFATAYGIDVRQHLEGYSFAGRTDRAIVADLAVAAGVSSDDADRGWEQYRTHVEQHMLDRVGASSIDVLPGVPALIDRLRAEASHTLALVTGNIRGVAFHKLSMAGLDHAFVHGAFGCEHANRSMLPPLALQRVNAAHGTAYIPEDCVVIGDAVNDVRCALDNGMKAVGVATGGIDASTLRSSGATVVFDSFADVDNVIERLHQLG
jgi:phosphoglycolate phosphatase-like HAD superfamily hydrolase